MVVGVTTLAPELHSVVTPEPGTVIAANGMDDTPKLLALTPALRLEGVPAQTLPGLADAVNDGKLKIETAVLPVAMHPVPASVAVTR